MSKVIKLPTGYTPEVTMTNSQIGALLEVLNEISHKLDEISEEQLMASKVMNTLLRGLESERKAKK